MFKSIKKFFSKEEVVEEESTFEVVEDTEEVVEYVRDPVIELQMEEVEPIQMRLNENEKIRAGFGPLRLQYLLTEKAYMDKIKSNNDEINELLKGLRTTYNVDPDVDYELNFPEEEGGLPSFKKL
tara:strand:- start:327 stop:701 length:375 start_codon:yes stop_codon:yes gene_type:complete